MKKIVAGILVVLLILFLLPYLLIPSRLRVSTSIPIHATTTSARLFLLDENRWPSWWPAGQVTGTFHHVFVYGEDSFSIHEKFYDRLTIHIRQRDHLLPTSLTIIPLSRDSVSVLWEYKGSASLQPIRRYKQYQATLKLQQQMTAILFSLQQFLQDEKNIYGITVSEDRVKDTLLVTTKAVFRGHTPPMADVYDLINSLRTYIAREGAVATNHPMLNSRLIDSTTTEVMVAIPVNKVLSNKNNVYFKRMVPGKILVTHVTGGPGTVRQALQQLDYYARDHQRVSPAIPFELLETDRLQVADTSKWVTGIYYPVL